MELSPAEHDSEAQEPRHPVSSLFAQSMRFDLDPFQVEACRALEDGSSVLVAAPTGAGKTIVGEFAIHLAMRTSTDKAFYTTPMKALSNQKFRELQEVYGPDNVGLLTGDTNINAHARVVVMTTEVLRNMIYAGSSALDDLRYVVMDEVHYLADRFRGAVWEEVIIHLPERVRLVSLSATVSNAEEFGDWLGTVRGDTAVIVSETRPVPLEQHVLARGDLLPLFDEGGARDNAVNRELLQMGRGLPSGGGGGSRRSRQRYQRPPRAGGRLDRAMAVELLQRQNLLPAIFFIFSRVGCDQAVQQVRRSGIRLTDRDERQKIRAIVEQRTAALQDEDLSVLGYYEWIDNLERGIASHHAGLLPAFKEVVEELFRRKLVKAVFATETLALGINMPARTVVLEKLEKFNGEARVPITPGEYTQLTGRAGRRGIDVEGHSVVHWTDGLDPHAVASLASRRTYPLNSSFRPTYNMAVNLIDQFGRQQAREILESSFAQFQADRAVVGMAREVKQTEESLAGYLRSMACDKGDFVEYAGLRRELSDLEKKDRKDISASKARQEERRNKMASLKKRMKRHSCHECADREQHARWGERYFKLKRSSDTMRRQIESRTGTVARQFDRIVDVLVALDYVRIDGDTAQLTDNGRTMKRIYGDRDLLVAEAIRRDLWRNLDAASLAAIACALVYEPRRDEQNGDFPMPRGDFREALDHTERLWAELDDLEQDHRLPGTSPVAAGLAHAMHLWARGQTLDRVLGSADMAAGDFVRWAKQTIDLLDQISLVAEGELARTARRALDAVRRGIVAYTGL
ncbi:DEAD/DEAH box helicase [Microbacterium amylolyticum]|uniref:ATP-dependent RNA helicase HelY n=1 Tax=Microbacterium amylolyticum TaxID=936337 RepID=A0ABS4ZH39_9MICO|nr:DEAD/DEAH box helicase [Microbacterium amylolyticum]MBP2435796.1 ATP-dependent RNA helicase HelY [Microbacterium amylolyticum]